MVTQPSSKLDVLTQESEYSIGKDPYPVDMYLFLDAPQRHLASEDNSSASLLIGSDPIAVAQSALVYWNKYQATGEEQLRENFLERRYGW